MRKSISILLVFILLGLLFTSGINTPIIHAAESSDDVSLLSTEELIQKIVYEDKIDEIYLFNDYYMGISYYKSHDELFLELISRDDCGIRLISLYNTMQNSSDEYALNIIRFLLQQYEIYSKLPTEDKIIVDSFQNVATITADNAIQVLSNTDAIYVHTPNGTPVEVKELDYVTGDAELPLTSIAESAAEYGIISTISAPTKKYNCHSYAWYSQNYNANYYWMDDPSNYYADSSYLPSEAAENYILCYFAEIYITLPDGTLVGQGVVNSHSAIITHVGTDFDKDDTSTLDSITVKSKWGQW